MENERRADCYTAVGLLDVDCVLRGMALRLAVQQAPFHRIVFRSNVLYSITAAVEKSFCAALLAESSLSPSSFTSSKLKVASVNDRLRIRLTIAPEKMPGLDSIAEFLQT
ncbi:hypothetical protein [Burkholderia ambifaria]|uniref:hypothetical protein n=1 Tax=Burkholderia ambifaria TaxID=152480 RepID=UPI001BA2210C|nr:hypothetical protein [Burkholderia ambifaria]MBR8256803.1 hypothetical protein [Burkholderia ambifaria]